MNANRGQGNHVGVGVVRSMCLSMVIGFLLSIAGRANDISVSNLSAAGQDIVAKTTLLEFDVAWENSWRMATNHDAAWLFVKYRYPETTGGWAHATLSVYDENHTAPAGATIVSVADGTGVFLQRSANGTGQVNFTGVQLQWDRGGVTNQTDVMVDVQVYAIEMVYIPQGEFAAGSGGSEASAFELTTINTADATAEGGFPSGQTAANDASWPNGFNAFYCMKYEISQSQYATFLNTLSEEHAVIRYADQNNNSRFTIGGSHPNFTATAPDRACNYMAWGDGTAYADWSGLRPMTELEFEKACRGSEAPVADEYAWGTADIYGDRYYIIDDGTPSAQIGNMAAGTGNASYSTTDGNINGPLRCGIFAASTVLARRVESGASFYGVMELSGNLMERTITIGNGTGRAFTGNHGDGALNAEGLMNVDGWPTEAGSGGGARGGAYSRPAGDLRVSARNMATSSIGARLSFNGFRGVRSAGSAP